MQLHINGEIFEVADGDGLRPLLWVLRDELGLTGTKYGCGAGICGSCTVHLDGVAARSCLTPLAQAAKAAIRTIEGLAQVQPDGSVRLHAVQQAFTEEQVPQCSWCMSGQMMTCAAFLEQNPAASEAQLLDAMQNNYCRCGCYARIRKGVLRAAQLAAQPAGTT